MKKSVRWILVVVCALLVLSAAVAIPSPELIEDGFWGDEGAFLRLFPSANAEEEALVSRDLPRDFSGGMPLDPDAFPALCGVADAIYNPLRSRLILRSRERGIPAEGGLYMLAAQAVKAAGLFRGCVCPEETTDEIYRRMLRRKENAVLIGMPGSGKSTVAELLAKKTGREAIDSDKVFSDRYGMNPSDYIREHGEEAFRRGESLILNDVCKLSGKIISTGGGAVTKRGNYEIIRQNGTVFWIIRDLDKLSVKGRPLSQKNGVNKLYEARKGMYELFSDFRIDNNGDAADTAKQIYGLLFGAGRQ